LGARSCWQRTIRVESPPWRRRVSSWSGHDGIFRRRRCARAQGSAPRGACPRHAPRDGPLRGRHARRLPFCAPGDRERRRCLRPPLGGDRVHCVARPRPCMGARRRGGCVGRARARDGRSQRDLAREGARHARVPRRGGSRCAAGVCPLLRTARRPGGGRRRAGVGRDLRGRLARVRDGGGRARAGGHAPAAVPPAGDPTRRRRGRLERLAGPRDVPRLPRPLRRRVRDTFVGRVRVRGHRMSTSKPSLKALASLAVALAGAAVAMIFFIAPEDADQGLSQKIFYVHVPIALTAYACFGLGAWKALRLLQTRGERYDLESYTGIHQGTIFGALTLLTGSIWAKASWGVWWTWSSNQLVLFLV